MRKWIHEKFTLTFPVVNRLLLFSFLPFRDFSEMIPHLIVLESQSKGLKLQSKLLDRTWIVKMPQDGDEDTVKIISEINLPRGVSVKLVTFGLSSNLNLKSSASYVVWLVSNLKVVMSCTKKKNNPFMYNISLTNVGRIGLECSNGLLLGTSCLAWKDSHAGCVVHMDERSFPTSIR